MANRRMFSNSIVDSDAFLDMPLSAQALYFHLCMRADDEGFINNYKKIQRMIGASDDDLKLLILKRFLITFDTGVVVIKHWYIHNYIQNDRFKPTVHQEEKKMLGKKENKSYTVIDNTENKCIQSVSSMYTECIQDVYSSDTERIQNQNGQRQKTPETRMNTNGYSLDTECIQNGYNLYAQDRIDKDSIDKISIEIDKIPDKENQSINQTIEIDFEKIIDKWNALAANYGVRPLRILGPTTERAKKLKSCIERFGPDSFDEIIKQIKQSDYLLGRTDRANSIDFEWAVEIENYTKILEGYYKNIEKPKGKVRNFCPEPDRKTEDFNKLEEQLLDN